MTPTRRNLLRASGLAVAAGVAGCTTGEPTPTTSTGVRVRDTFDADAPVAVPVGLSLAVRNVDSTDAALRGVEVVALDGERKELAATELGEFSYGDADPQQRRTERHDRGIFGSARIYEAEWHIERTIEAPAVPRWLTFRVEEVWFGDDADDGPTQGVVGEAAASQPAPHLELVASRLRAADPLPARVGPDHYESHRWGIQQWDVDGGTYLPTGYQSQASLASTRASPG